MEMNDGLEKRLQQKIENGAGGGTNDKIRGTGHGAGASTDQPKIMKTAIFNRRDELRDLSIFHFCPGNEPGWLDPGHEDHFKVDITGYTSTLGRPAVTEKRAGFIPQCLGHDPERF